MNILKKGFLSLSFCAFAAQGAAQQNKSVVKTESSGVTFCVVKDSTHYAAAVLQADTIALYEPSHATASVRRKDFLAASEYFAPYLKMKDDEKKAERRTTAEVLGGIAGAIWLISFGRRKLKQRECQKELQRKEAERDRRSRQEREAELQFQREKEADAHMQTAREIIVLAQPLRPKKKRHGFARKGAA